MVVVLVAEIVIIIKTKEDLNFLLIVTRLQINLEEY